MNAEALCKKYEAVKSDRQSRMDWLWQNIADYIVLRKSAITVKKVPSSEDWVTNLFSDTASNANMVMAAGMVTNSTPITNRWMSYEVADVVKQINAGAPNAMRWYADATDIAMRELARSNFYTQIHEMHLERGAFGTCCIFCFVGKKGPLNFKTIPVGSYCVEEDYEGTVDVIWVESTMTARQIVQQFGVENVGEKVKEAFLDQKKDGSTFTVVNKIFPRMERQPGKIDKKNKPIGSVHVCLEDKHILAEEGYDEMPGVVGRYLRWPGEVWGWGPGLQALPIIRQLNHIEKQADIIAEKMADPPSLTPSNLDGQVDLRARGNTVFDENTPNALPQFLQLNSNVQALQWRIESKEKAVKDCFHNDLFQMFSQIDGGTSRMTQLEIMQRSSEKLDQFSPAFTSFQTEVLEPLMRRVFSILFNQGLFGEPPPDAIVDGSLILPKFAYSSKLSMALKSLDNRAFIDAVSILMPMAQIDPTVFDRINIAEGTKMILENSGVPPRCIRTDEEVAMIQQQRAEQQEIAAKMQMLESGSKSAKNLADVPEDSIEEALENIDAN